MILPDVSGSGKSDGDKHLPPLCIILKEKKMTKFFVLHDDGKREYFEEKSSALRRAAALTKFKKAVISVYDKDGRFIKSFDGRK